MSDLEHSLSWVRRNMPLTEEQIAALPTLTKVRLACSVHLEIKTLPFFEAFLEKGGEIFLATCNPQTVRDEVVNRLVSHGARAHAWRGMTGKDQDEAAQQALAWRPTHLYEMGANLVAWLMEATLRGPQEASVVAGLEATGSGISRISALLRAGQELRFPVFNCDDVPIKEGLHNRHLVGVSTWQAFMEKTQLSLHGRRVLVVGFGLVGQGVAEAARAFGGTVSVADKDPARALFASYAGYRTGSLEDLAAEADVIVTATGRPGVLAARHIALLKEGCFLLNVGHAPDEIDVSALGPRREVVPHVEEAEPGGAKVYLFAGGSMANLTAGQGDPLNSFDITMATLAAGLRFLVSSEAARFPPGLHPLPRSAWEQVARRASRA